MAARHPRNDRTANVLRQQVVRADYRRTIETSRPSQAEKNIPDVLRDLLQRLDDAEKKQDR
ncbi:hypothetical protein [Phyllobacterium sp. YR531]|uniref:hypothetical protein n=1 Tax=Phyllobacterium sp. YR531 TaxID=1144343 RepID=UPI0012F6693C|nr:hypothetical protein [Phyllobacterium sp. YR531]